LFLAATCVGASAADAQGQANRSLPLVRSGCEQALSAPIAEPATGSTPVVLFLELCFAERGARTQPPPDSYIEQIRVMSFISTPSRGVWRPFTVEVERTVADDLNRLRALSEVDAATATFTDYRFPNGVVGKVITYYISERGRTPAC
jgi:hypothetical protein